MDQADQATDLTPAEKAAIRQQWADVTRDWKVHGPDFFIRLFKECPSIRGFFKAFKDKNFDEIRASPVLRAHAVNFKQGVRSFVDNLDDGDCLVVLVRKMAANHYRRGIRTKEFQAAFSVFVDFLEDVSDTGVTTRAAWERALAVIAGILDTHMVELARDGGPL